MGVQADVRSDIVWRSAYRQRRVPLGTPIDFDTVWHGIDRLRSLQGVRRVDSYVGRDAELIVDYDLVRVRLEDIEALLESAGVRLNRSPARHSLRSAVYRMERDEQRFMRGPGQYCELYCDLPR